MTDTDLEAEFDNIYNNPLTLISPLTGDLAAGGNKITGLSLGSSASPSLQFTGDADTGIYSPSGDRIALVAGAMDVFTVLLSGGVGIAQLLSTEAGSLGPRLTFFHSSASPADNDFVGTVDFSGKDDGGTQRTVGQITTKFDDVTSTTMDSEMLFSVMDNVNAGNAATTASLTSLGTWTDASAAAGKTFEGDIENVLTKLRTMSIGVYRGRNVPPQKLANAERHYSSTAEEFFQVFKLGKNPALTATPGIAPKDVAWLAVKACLELEDRVAALEAA